MGFYLRKSISVGPLRFNLSKSGIAVSSGVNGLRFGTAPHGNYVHMGRDGLYYRTIFPSSSPSPRFQSDNNIDLVIPSEAHAELKEIESANISKIVDSSSQELLSELNQKRKIIRLWPIAATVSVIIIFFGYLKDWQNWLLLVTLIFDLALIYIAFSHDTLAKTVVLLYDFDPEMQAAYGVLHSAAETIAGCAAVWHIEGRDNVLDSKYHAGASSLIRRKTTSIRKESPPYIKSNIETIAVGVGRQTLHFFPDCVLIYDSNGIGAVSYQELRINVKQSRFIEDGAPPRDAKVVDRTWKYVNKSGNPDRRFKDNFELPICLYDEISLSSQTGLNEILQISQCDIAGAFAEAILDLSRKIQIGKSNLASNQGAIIVPTPAPVHVPVDFRIPVAPEGYGEAKWIPTEQSVEIDGITIPGGMVYVGTILKAGYGSNDPCLIDPSKLVSASGDFTVGHLSYWPSYSDISATDRRAYLEWLADGRKHPEADIGFVFLFFYGLERRVIIDATTDSAILADYPVIAQEIRRLLSIYGGKSGSFQGYASGLLDWVSLGMLENNKLYLEQVPELSKTYELPFYIRLCLGMAAVDRAPVPNHLACAWSKLEPGIITRTPARRCPEYFDKLFEQKYTEIFGSGIVLSPNRTKLKVVYRPASAGLRGVNDSLLTKTCGDLPDVSILTGPLKKLQQVVYAVNDALDPYSRAITKNAEAKNTLDCLIYLPVALWPDDMQKALAELRSKVNQSTVTLPFQELLSKLNGNAVLSKEKTLVLARVLESMNIGMEPDVLSAAKSLKAEDTVVLFADQSDDELPRTTRAYQSAALTLQLSSAVAMAGGEFSATEMNYLQEQINLWTHLSVSHQRRLIAYLNLLKSSPVSLAGLKKKFEPLSLSERESIAAFLATVAQSDGKVLPAEVASLQYIYKAMGVEPNKVFSNIHALASGNKPASVTTSKMEAGFTLNAERIAQLQRESEKVSTLLADIFKEDEHVIPNQLTQEPAPKIDSVDDSQRFLGLDESHTALARMLLSRPQWSREDLLDVAADLNLMLDGALEHVNEASFDTYDIAFTDGDDPITINQEIFEKMEP